MEERHPEIRVSKVNYKNSTGKDSAFFLNW